MPCRLQAAQLLCSFREYHRRASFGLSAYCGQKLAAFEDVLLNAREALFSAPANQEQQQQQEEQLKVGVHCRTDTICLWCCQNRAWVSKQCRHGGNNTGAVADSCYGKLHWMSSPAQESLHTSHSIPETCHWSKSLLCFTPPLKQPTL